MIYGNKLWYVNTGTAVACFKISATLPSKGGPVPPPPQKKMGDPLPTFKQFDLEQQNLYDNTCGVVVCFWGVSHAPVPRGRGPSGPKFVRTSYVHPHSMRNDKQIFHGDQTRSEGKF